MAVNRSRGTPEALFMAIRQLVLAGLPTTSTRTIVSGAGGESPALNGEDGAVGLQQVLALHPLGAGPGAHQQRDLDAVEGLVGVVAEHHAGQQPEGAVV